jgi:hypothetical protein
MPIIRSFTDIKASRSQSETPVMALPPAVLMLYGLGITDSVPDASQSTTFYGNTIAILKMLDATTFIKATVNDPFTLRPATTFTFDSNAPCPRPRKASSRPRKVQGF